MATYEYESLKEKYSSFMKPSIVIRVNDKELTDKKKGFPVGEVEVELTSGYEASVAEFSIFNVYDLIQNEFLYDEVSKYIFLGSKIEIEMGYRAITTLVFIGVITRVNFLYETEGIPCIRVTAMDVKGVMMSGSYDLQLKATNYADAVKEILKRTAYEKLRNSGIIQNITVDDTPDKRNSMGQENDEASDKTIEMVAESDYEFVVKIGKRNNFEFFTECGNVIFRKAKSDTKILMEISPTMPLRNFDISYDITGIVEKVVVRGMDVSKAKVIKAEKKFSNSISQGNKAKAVIKGSQKVYIDSTLSSKEEAETRVESLMENMSYRYGTLRCELIGIPELQPGHFIRMSGLGTGPDNKFYLNRVKHVYDDEGRYHVELEGIGDSAGNEDVFGDIGSISSLF